MIPVFVGGCAPEPRGRPLCAKWALALLAALAGGAVACGPTTPTSATAAAPTDLVPWQGRAAEVFDDNIDPASVGLTMEGASARADVFLRERAQTSELVARVRVQTVTVDSIGDQSTYHLGMEVSLPLATPKYTDPRFEIVIRPQSPAFFIAKSFDARLRGSSFIGFFHRFAGSDGEVVVHFHLAPDTADVAQAVKDAVALREISGS